MAQVIVRGLDDGVVDRLKERARLNGHSLEHELRLILAEASMPTSAELLEELARIRAMTPKVEQSDSTDLVRHERDRA